MHFWLHPVFLAASALWAAAFLWMVVNALRAPLAKEDQDGFHLLTPR